MMLLIFLNLFKERKAVNMINITMILKHLYWKWIPYPCRKKIEQARLHQYKKQVMEELRMNIKNKKNAKEFQGILDRIMMHGLGVYNYDFVDNYSLRQFIEKIQYDRIAKMYYFLRNGKKMYISRKYNTAEMAAVCYKNICVEQDESSPHRYLSKDFNVTEGGILVDIGAAEGFFSLDNIQNFRKIYLLECDFNWIEALNQTFSNDIGEKVIIVPKFASDANGSSCITIDRLLRNETLDKLTIKMDVEGAEAKVLNGCKKCFALAKEVSAFITCYHRPDDSKELLSYIEGFEYEFSQGYMINIFEKKLCKPYFRKGVIRAKKK